MVKHGEEFVNDGSGSSGDGILITDEEDDDDVVRVLDLNSRSKPRSP